MDSNKQKQMVNTYLQELAILLLADIPIKGVLRDAAQQSRGKLLGDLKPEQREVYLASKNIIMELGRQLAGCKDLDTLAKALETVKSLTNGEIYEYDEVKDRIIQA
jgi:hypothetical protein